MNNLSWAIYGIDVVSSAGVFFGLLTFAGIGCVVASIVQHCVRWPTYSWEDSSPENKASILAETKRYLKYSLSAVIAFGLISILVPSRQTLLLIASSEMGERVLKSDAVQDIVNPGADLLKAWIKDETSKLSGAKK